MKQENRALEKRTMIETSITRQSAGEALAAAEEAQVKARFAMAYARARDVDQFRINLLREAARPGFANVAIYAKPRAKKLIKGPSVRFADTAARLFGNLDVQQRTLLDTDEIRQVLITATDLQSNVTKSETITVRKISEKRVVYDRDKILGTRINSEGIEIFLVQATDDDIYMLEHAAAAKARRNIELQLLPADIVEEAIQAAETTMSQTDGKDPGAKRKTMVDSFFSLGITPAQIRDYLGRDLETLTEKDLLHLRQLWTAINEGATWADIIGSDPEENTDSKSSEKKEQDPVDSIIVKLS